jgi:hypothetical protein
VSERERDRDRERERENREQSEREQRESVCMCVCERDRVRGGWAVYNKQSPQAVLTDVGDCSVVETPSDPMEARSSPCRSSS